jgi:hypothetical protein
MQVHPSRSTKGGWSQRPGRRVGKAPSGSAHACRVARDAGVIAGSSAGLEASLDGARGAGPTNADCHVQAPSFSLHSRARCTHGLAALTGSLHSRAAASGCLNRLSVPPNRTQRSRRSVLPEHSAGSPVRQADPAKPIRRSRLACLRTARPTSPRVWCGAWTLGLTHGQARRPRRRSSTSSHSR